MGMMCHQRWSRRISRNAAGSADGTAFWLAVRLVDQRGFVVFVAFGVAIFVRMPPWMNAAAAVRTPPWMNVAASAEEGARKKAGLREAFANRNIWLVSATFLLLYIPYNAFSTFYVDLSN